jgi:hypothetical protein
VRPKDRETRLFLNDEICHIACSFPFVVEPKNKDFFQQQKNNPVDWARVTILPDSTVSFMEQSLGKI